MDERGSLRLLFTRLPIDPDEPPRPSVPPLPPHVAALFVAVGGVGGSLARAAIGQLLPNTPSAWPWPTLIVNVTGSGLLALLLVTLVERHPGARIPRPLLGTGVLGGFTTFSTFAVNAVELSHAGRSGLAGLYVIASVLGSMIAAVLGLFAARAIDRLGDEDRWLRRVRHIQQPVPIKKPNR